MKNKKIECLLKLMEANIALCEYGKHDIDDAEKKKMFSRNIRDTKKAMEKIHHIKHSEIVDSIFKNAFTGKEFVFVLPPLLVISKKVDRWDNTEEGFKEFLALEEEAKKQEKERMEQMIQRQERIKKAKEEGKKVEFVVKDGKMEELIVNE